MSDMARYCEAKSDQLNNVDLISGKRIIKINKVKVTNTGKQDCTIWYDGDNGKPWKPCKTMARILMEAWGENIQNYVGKYVELFRDPEVLYGGKKEGGIRISGLSDIKSEFETVVRISRQQTKPVMITKIVPPREDMPLADLTEAGKTASSHGTEHYKTWFTSLTATEKKSVEGQHAEWKKAAGEVDARAADAQKTAE